MPANWTRAGTDAEPNERSRWMVSFSLLPATELRYVQAFMLIHNFGYLFIKCILSGWEMSHQSHLVLCLNGQISMKTLMYFEVPYTVRKVDLSLLRGYKQIWNRLRNKNSVAVPVTAPKISCFENINFEMELFINQIEIFVFDCFQMF